MVIFDLSLHSPGGDVATGFALLDKSGDYITEKHLYLFEFNIEMQCL